MVDLDCLYCIFPIVCLAVRDDRGRQTTSQQSVLEDVQRIRNHPLVPGDIPIYGYIYDVKSGKLIEVPAATAAGRAR